jgi:hypothetical protein
LHRYLTFDFSIVLARRSIDDVVGNSFRRRKLVKESNRAVREIVRYYDVVDLSRNFVSASSAVRLIGESSLDTPQMPQTVKT